MSQAKAGKVRGLLLSGDRLSGDRSAKRRRIAGAALIAAAALATRAAGNTWTGVTSADWSTGTNWSGGEPTSATSAVFPVGFPGARNPITLSTGEACSSLSISDSYTFSSGTLSISGTGLVSVDPSKTATIASVLAGTNGSTKTSSGTLILSGANTFTGGVAVSDGLLAIASDGNLGSTANSVTIATTLESTASFSSARTFLMGGFGGTIVTDTGTTLTLSGPVNGTTSLIKAGLGRLILGAVSSRSTSTVVTQGSLRLQNQTTAAGSGQIQLQFGSSRTTLEIQGGLSIANAISMIGGNTIVAAGSATLTGPMTIPNGMHISTSASTDTLTIQGAITGSAPGATMNIDGPGTLYLPNANSGAAHDWDVNAGTLRIGNVGSLGSGTTAVFVQNGAQLELTGITLDRAITLAGGSTLRNTGGFSGAVGLVSPVSGTVTLDAGPGAFDVLTIGNETNDLSGSSSTLATTGLGTVVLGYGNNYSGSWNIQNSTVRIQNAAALGTGLSPVAIASFSTLEISGATLDRSLSPSSASSVRGTSAAGSVGTMTLPGAGNNTAFISGPDAAAVFTLGNFANDITGGSSTTTVNIHGPGTVLVPNSNNCSAAWTVNSGTLRIENSSALGTAASNKVAIGNTGTFEVGGVPFALPIFINSGGTLSGTGTSSTTGVITVPFISGPVVTLATKNTADVLTIGDSANDLTGGNGGQFGARINVAGPGRIVLAQPSDCAVYWNLAGGTLQISADSQLGNSNNQIIMDGGTLRTGAPVTSNRKLVLNAGGGTIDSNGFDSSFGDVDPGNLTKNGNGKVSVRTLTALNVTVNAGTLALKNRATTGGRQVARMTALSINPAAKLDLNDNDLVVSNGNFSTLQGLVLGGYRGAPDSTATGIVSTTSQTVHNGTTILALFDNSFAGFNDWPQGSGMTIAVAAIVGKYTYVGDTNMDGQVTPQDYTATDANLNTSVDPRIAWFYGDTNFDGNINSSDYTGIDAALGLGVGNPLAAQGLAAVPEPAVGLIAGGGLLLLRRRRFRGAPL